MRDEEQLFNPAHLLNLFILFFVELCHIVSMVHLSCFALLAMLGCLMSITHLVLKYISHTMEIRMI